MGFSPAFYYVPLLLAYNLQLEQIIQTNAFLSVVSTFSGTILNMIFGRMPYDYFLADAIVTTIGTIIGIYLQKLVVRKTGKTQYSMMGFNFVIFVSLISIGAYQSVILTQKHKAGVDIFKAPDYCE